MPDYSPREGLPADFCAATEQAPPPSKRTVTIDLDADLVEWFERQAQKGGLPWQQEVNGLMRFYVESNEAQEADIAAMMNGPEPAA